MIGHARRDPEHPRRLAEQNARPQEGRRAVGRRLAEVVEGHVEAVDGAGDTWREEERVGARRLVPCVIELAVRRDNVLSGAALLRWSRW